MEYTISEIREQHLKNHFHKSNLSGSIFDQRAFQNVKVFLKYLNSNSPKKVIIQSNGNQVHVFNYNDGKTVGWQGFAARKDVLENKIIEEIRNNHRIKIALVEEMLPTNEFCVVIKAMSSFEIITAFPGNYCPPFPSESQNSEERQLSIDFWGNHILIKKLR